MHSNQLVCTMQTHFRDLVTYAQPVVKCRTLHFKRNRFCEGNKHSCTYLHSFNRFSSIITTVERKFWLHNFGDCTSSTSEDVIFYYHYSWVFSLEQIRVALFGSQSKLCLANMFWNRLLWTLLLSHGVWSSFVQEVAGLYQ